MLKSKIDLSNQRHSFDDNILFKQIKFPNKRKRFVSSNLRISNQEPSLITSTIKINQLYICFEKQFNQFHKQQLTLNEQKFNKSYIRALAKLEINQVQSIKNKLENPQQRQFIFKSIIEQADQIQSSDQKTLAETTHEIGQKDNLKQIVIQPLKFTKHANGYRTPKKSNANKLRYEQASDKPSSCRTIIMDLQDLIQK